MIYQVGDLKICCSPISGRGVFALGPYQPGDLIEVCPLLQLDRNAWGISEILDDYVIKLPDPRRPIALALGYGSLYNHSALPNADWTINKARTEMHVTAKSLIGSGEEILICYGAEYFSARGIAVL
jgi:SET domain